MREKELPNAEMGHVFLGMVYLVAWMTKPELDRRFTEGFGKRRFAILFHLPCGGIVEYLAEDPAAARGRLAAGEVDYEPRLDVDRYCVACPSEVAELHCCPSWDAIRKALAVAGQVVEGDGAQAVSVKVDGRADDEGCSRPVVCDADGRAGRIGRIDEWEEAKRSLPVAEIVAASEECVHGGDDSGYGAKCYRQIESHPAKMFNSSHEGIIAKILGWLGLA